MSLTTVSIRPPLPHEEAHFVELCLGLTRFNHSHAPISDLDNVLVARTLKARQLFHNDDPNHLILLAVLDDIPVGYVYAMLIQPEPWVSSGTELLAFLDELFLLEESRGHQLGKKLMQEVESWALAKGAAQLRLEAFHWNESARAFYERDGLELHSVTYRKNLF